MEHQRRILAVYAHPDDAEIWAGGTLLAHKAVGDLTSVCVLTHGDSPRAMESAQGIAALGASLYQLALPDRAIEANAHAIALVAEVLREEQPDMLLTHWADDWHPDHEATWRILRSAVMVAQIENHLQAIFWSDTYNSLGLHRQFEPDTYVDVTSVWDRKLEAIAAHASQGVSHYIDLMTRICSIYGARSNVQLAEGFRRVPFFGKGRTATQTLWQSR